MAGDDVGRLGGRTGGVVHELLVLLDVRLRRVIVMTRRGVRQIRTGLGGRLGLMVLYLGLTDS